MATDIFSNAEEISRVARIIGTGLAILGIIVVAHMVITLYNDMKMVFLETSLSKDRYDKAFDDLKNWEIQLRMRESRIHIREIQLGIKNPSSQSSHRSPPKESRRSRIKKKLENLSKNNDNQNEAKLAAEIAKKLRDK